MVRLDTTTLLIDLSMVNYINEMYFETIFRYDNVYDEKQDDFKRQLIKEQLILKDDFKGGGLNMFTIDKSTGKVKIDVSAKILEGDYLEGITINTIDRVIKKLQYRLMGLSFKNDNEVIDNCYVLKCDVTDNIYLSEALSNYIEAIQRYCVNNKYRIDTYNNYSLVATRNVKSYKERITLYDKIVEMQKKDKRLFQLLDAQHRFKSLNLCRVESNHTSFERLRKVFGIEKDDCIERDGVRYIRLLDVLQSNEKVNYNIMKRVTNLKLPDTLTNDYNMKFHEIEKWLGRKKIIEDCNYDIDLIQLFIKKYVKGNVNQYVRQYKALINKMKQDEVKQNKSDSRYVDELLQLLAG